MRPNRRGFSSLLLSLLSLAVASSVRADHIVLQNGTTVDGEVSAENDQTVTVDVSVPGSSLTVARRLTKAQIKSWDRPSREGPAYVTIPLIGEIGAEVTADGLRAGLAEARAVHAKYVVLAIDSPGGRIGAMSDIIDVLTDASREFEIVSYVNNAYSAAAVIAMTSRQVYMKPSASIGAAVPFRMTENGPADIDAKFRSPIEAKMRAATAHGGHADLLIRGMTELDLELVLVRDPATGQPDLRTSGEGKRIKSKGEILTLNAAEAEECGLAKVVPGLPALGEQVAAGPWHEASRRPWNVVMRSVAAEREKAESAQRAMVRAKAMRRVKPEYDRLDQRIAALVARFAATQVAANDLTAKYNAEVEQIELERKLAVEQAEQRHDRQGIVHATEVANSRKSSARQYLNASLAQFKADADTALLEAAQLRDRQKALIASVPTD
jgi:ATP-dependent protease ClpP protease subunit